MTECELHFQYTPSMARGAVLASLWDRYLVHVVASVLVFVLCLIQLNNLDMRPLASFGLGAIAIVWWSWLEAYLWAGYTIEHMRDPKIIVKLSESGVAFQNADAISQLSWSSVRVVRRLRSVWVIQLRDSRGLRFVPVSALTPETEELVVRMVRKAGGRVR